MQHGTPDIQPPEPDAHTDELPLTEEERQSADTVKEVWLAEMAAHHLGVTVPQFRGLVEEGLIVSQYRMPRLKQAAHDLRGFDPDYIQSKAVELQQLRSNVLKAAGDSTSLRLIRRLLQADPSWGTTAKMPTATKPTQD